MLDGLCGLGVDLDASAPWGGDATVLGSRMHSIRFASASASLCVPVKLGRPSRGGIIISDQTLASPTAIGMTTRCSFINRQYSVRSATVRWLHANDRGRRARLGSRTPSCPPHVRAPARRRGLRAAYLVAVYARSRHTVAVNRQLQSPIGFYNSKLTRL